LNSFFEAEKKGAVICDSLEITLRERTQDHVVFLVTRESRVVAQMKMESELWEHPVKTKAVYSLLVNRAKALEKLHRPASSVRELRKGMKDVNLKVTLTEKSKVVCWRSLHSGRPVRLCIATVADPSGSIRLVLWDDEIDVVSVGDEIEIKNASVGSFRGLRQIILPRKKGELIVVTPSKQVDAKQAIQALVEERHRPIKPAEA